MLTLTETVDAIRKIDTDDDVIRNACKQLLKQGEAQYTVETLAETLVNTCSATLDPKMSIKSTIIALATLAVCSAKPGHEPPLLQALVYDLTHAYYKALSGVLKEQSKTDPVGATLRAMHILRDLRDMVKDQK